MSFYAMKSETFLTAQVAAWALPLHNVVSVYVDPDGGRPAIIEIEGEGDAEAQFVEQFAGIVSKLEDDHCVLNNHFSVDFFGPTAEMAVAPFAVDFESSWPRDAIRASEQRIYDFDQNAGRGLVADDFTVYGDFCYADAGYAYALVEMPYLEFRIVLHSDKAKCLWSELFPFSEAA